MNASKPNGPQPRRRRRRWLILLLIGALAIPVVGALALPWALGTGAGKAWLVGRANRALAPGGFGLATIRFSWFGPTRMTGLVLRDAAGDRVVEAPRATWDRNLWQILFDQPRLGTLRLDGAAIDAERSPDGAIDLYETLRPLLGRDPATSLRVEVPNGRLRARAEGVMEPVVAEHAAITLEIAPVPGPVSWKARLSNGAGGAPSSSLAVEGRFVRGEEVAGKLAVKELEARVAGKDWPWTLVGPGHRVSGRLDGTAEAVKSAEGWTLKGDATLGRLVASGRWLAGDTLRLEKVRGVWDVAAADAGWTVRALELDSPLATLKAEGTSQVVGRLDLAALAAQLPHALRLREGVALEQGTADVRLESQEGPQGAAFDLTARVSDLRARDRDRSFTLRDPATLKADVRRAGASWDLVRLSAETPYFRGEAQGDPARGVSLSATFDLAGLQRQLRDLVDFGKLDLAGRGGLTGDYKAESGRFRGNLKGDVQGLRLAGVGPSAVERDRVLLTLGFDGPAGGSGLPDGWSAATARLTTGAVTADLTAKADGRHLSGVVSGPLRVGSQAASAEGRFEARGVEGGWALDPIVLALKADGEGAPAPLRLAAVGRFDRASGELTLRPGGDGNGPEAIAFDRQGLTIAGLGGGKGLRVDGGLVGDLAPLADWLEAAPEGLSGGWALRVSGKPDDDGWQLAARLDVKDLAWSATPPAREQTPGEGRGGEAVALAVRALVPNGGGRVDLAELSLSSPYVTVEAAGTVDDPGGEAVAGLKGTIAPNWKALTEWLAAHVEPGARVDGRPRAFRVRVPLGEGWRDAVDGEVGVAVESLDVYGMRLGRTSLVARAREGKTSLDPIDSTINEGRLHVEPSYRDGAGGPALVLGKGTRLTDAKVNDEVSRRVLSFVAPILNNATRVNGLVSADIDQAVFPLRRGGGTGATVKGSVVFQDVRFAPSGVFRDLLAQVGREDASLIRIDKPVAMEIADRRVYQRGLVIPVGKLSQVEMDGWVGFDRDLNVTISLPVLPTTLADKPVIGGIAANSRIRIPIRGTMDRPEIDEEAFKVGMKELGRSVLEQGIGQGVLDLFRRFSQDRDPNAPPPPPRLTPQERRERRLEKKAERRMRRGLPP